jgi:peroxiredoxin
MKRHFWIVFGGCLAVGCSGGQHRQESGFVASPQHFTGKVQTLAIGDPAPDFRLPGVDGRWYTLADFSETKVLAVVFTCNHCPTAQAYEDRIQSVARDYRDRGVALVAISPNSPLALLDEECGYTDLGDTYEEMKIRAETRRFEFPYLYDGDTQMVAAAYGPTATPHGFVFDGERRLRYQGRVDGSERPGSASAEDFRGALDAVLAGNPVASPITKAFGCSVKWADEKTLAWKERVDRQWRELPVELAEVDAAGVRELLANPGNKLRLVNIWATWCGPCVIEYPEFIRIHRMFKDRDFEFVSLSADDPESRDAVLKFLREKHSAVRNLVFRGGDQYALIEAVDSGWNGALPFTILVEPGGKVVYQVEGTIEPLALRRAIVDHPLIGRYYR